jgi:hypothetical protein
MYAGPSPITLIIGTDIAVIGAGGACYVKTVVAPFLTGVTLGLRTGLNPKLADFINTYFNSSTV